MDNRIIALNGEVNESSSMKIILELLKMDAENNKQPIYLYINSPGGSIIHGLAIYDVINNITSPVYTVCNGMAASMGAFLLSCGKKGHRYSLPHSRILIHQPLIYNQYSSSIEESEIQIIAGNLRKNRDELEAIMAKNSDKDIKEFHKDCERDHWMSAQEALEYGLIDKII